MLEKHVSRTRFYVSNFFASTRMRHISPLAARRGGVELLCLTDLPLPSFDRASAAAAEEPMAGAPTGWSIGRGIRDARLRTPRGADGGTRLPLGAGVRERCAAAATDAPPAKDAPELPRITGGLPRPPAAYGTVAIEGALLLELRKTPRGGACEQGARNILPAGGRLLKPSSEPK